MKVLFLHPNIPGQFKHLCRVLAEDPENTVVFVSKERDHINIPGVYKVSYRVPREPSASTHRYILGFERSVLQGQEVWRMCKRLKDDEGFVPDVIVAHPGWGDAMYIKDIYPDAPLLNFFEFFYHTEGADINFDPEDLSTLDDFARVRTKNATNLFALQYCEWGISPTHWQAGLHPKEYHHRISVIHDGIDTDMIQPSDDVTYTLPNGHTLTRQDEVITYVARNFEPYRGFPTFMKAAERLLKERPNCQILAVGRDNVSYGKKAPDGKTYRELWMDKVNLGDGSRIHFLGALPYDNFLKMLQISTAHIYLSYPFVLSWSALEAMASGCVVVGSNTPPLQEVFEDGRNGLLFDFFDPDGLVEKVISVLDHPDRMQDVRREARDTVVRKYALKDLLPLHLGLIRDLAAGELPPSTAQRIDALPANAERHAPMTQWSPKAFVDPMLVRAA